MDPFSTIVSVGGSLLGGLFGDSSREKANAAMLADKEKDRELQKEFAQSGIQWRVADAKAAGIHPVYALGGSGASYTPSAISLDGGSSMASALSSSGQEIGRAINATRSAPQRADAFTEATQKLTLDKMGLENQLLASQIAKMNANPNPPMPIGQRYLVDGQGQTASGPTTSLSVPGLVNDQAMKRTASAPGTPWQEPGAINDVGYARTKTGYVPIPSADVKERIEDNFIQETMHAVRNNLLPSIAPYFNDPPYKAPPGKAWVYSPWRQEYQLVPDQAHRKFFRY